MIDYSTLNPEQHEAVFSDHSRILCLAGAGTGKTQVLTRRVARLYEAGICPENMLALTFTRAAGAEMKERVIGLIGEDGKKLFCNTFHAFCVDVIRAYADALDYEPNFSVYDQPECDEILAEVLQSLKYKIPAKRFNDYRAGRTAGMTAADAKQAERAVAEYEYRLKRNNAFDFDGLINTVKKAVFDHTDICAALKKQYTHVFVDEFQDTDGDQWAIVQGISPQNLFVVGDDFQSIYAFRGSDISIILGLADNPDWQMVKLERNYRSTHPIIAAANALIKHNRQTEKQLFTETQGAEIILRQPTDDTAEIMEIVPYLQESQKSRRTTAILARTNKQLDRAKSLLESKGVPCETLATTDNPLAGKGAKELFAWIAAIINPLDDVAIRKIATGKVSKKTLMDAEFAQLNSGGSLLEAIKEIEEPMPAPYDKTFSVVYNNICEVFYQDDVVAYAANRLVVALGINDHGARYEISKWNQRQLDLGEDASPAALLEWVRMSNVAEKSTKERDASKTYLMTVHGSKGLEFDEVYIIGAAQGTFPNRGDLQEERRLFYVAITRAKSRLSISCPKIMSGWNGKAQPVQRSQFIAEAGLLR